MTALDSVNKLKLKCYDDVKAVSYDIISVIKS